MLLKRHYDKWSSWNAAKSVTLACIQIDMCCDLVGSVWGRKHWLWDTARKRNAFLLLWESFNSYNFGTIGPIQVGGSAKGTSPNEEFNQIENKKGHIFDFWLISQERITYNGCLCLEKNCVSCWEWQKETVYICMNRLQQFAKPGLNRFLSHAMDMPA